MHQLKTDVTDFSVRLANDHRFGKELFIRFTVRVFRERLPIPFQFWGRDVGLDCINF